MEWTHHAASLLLTWQSLRFEAAGFQPAACDPALLQT